MLQIFCAVHLKHHRSNHQYLEVTNRKFDSQETVVLQQITVN
jgi:hypothetical protein